MSRGLSALNVESGVGQSIFLRLDVVFRDLKPENIVLDAALPMPQCEKERGRDVQYLYIYKYIITF